MLPSMFHALSNHEGSPMSLMSRSPARLFVASLMLYLVGACNKDKNDHGGGPSNGGGPNGNNGNQEGLTEAPVIKADFTATAGVLVLDPSGAALTDGMALDGGPDGAD